MVFSVPALHEVHEGRMKSIVMKASESEALCLEKAPAYERLKGMLRELDIGYVNLLPDFREAMRGREIKLFRMSDEHWNPEGHALAAETVGTFLLENGYVPDDHLDR